MCLSWLFTHSKGLEMLLYSYKKKSWHPKMSLSLGLNPISQSSFFKGRHNHVTIVSQSCFSPFCFFSLCHSQTYYVINKSRKLRRWGRFSKAKPTRASCLFKEIQPLKWMAPHVSSWSGLSIGSGKLE